MGHDFLFLVLDVGIVLPYPLESRSSISIRHNSDNILPIVVSGPVARPRWLATNNMDEVCGYEGVYVILSWK
jgi:hypothetical protein